MATYKNLRRGSNGDDVIKLQENLINAGYDVGSSGADGSYGKNTEAAVTKYQQDNGLKVDGIAGSETLGKLYGGGDTSTNTGNANNTAENVPDYSAGEDLDVNAMYEETINALLAEPLAMPTFESAYDEDIQKFYNQIVGREDFSYNVNEDALYKQIEEQYLKNGRTAMDDTIAKASAMTGGYGNSYAQSAGQQAYYNYLSELQDVIPELEQRAYERYADEGDELFNLLSASKTMRDSDYEEYQDELNKYYTDLGLLADYENQQYTREWNENEREYSREQDAIDNAIQREQLELSKASTYASINASKDASYYLSKLENLEFTGDVNSTTQAKAIEGIKTKSTPSGAYNYLVYLIENEGLHPTAAAEIYAGWVRVNSNTYNANDYTEIETEISKMASDGKTNDELEEKIIEYIDNGKISEDVGKSILARYI